MAQNKSASGQGERDADAGGTFHNAGSNLEQPPTQGVKLGFCQSCVLGHRLLNAPQQPVGSGVQDEAHLIGTVPSGTTCNRWQACSCAA